MNLQQYKSRREHQLSSEQEYRAICHRCLQPQFGCYCGDLQQIDTKMKVIILIHPIEVKRRIATGRMSHLSIKDSHLIKGQDYTQNAELNTLLADSQYQPVVLYPGRNSFNLTNLSLTEQRSMFSPEKKLALIVIDGTWATAGRMIRQSKNLIDLPRICFTPRGISQFRVRKQPAPECLSTIEAIHQAIELLQPALGIDASAREHDRLLDVFNKMVERQLNCIRESYDSPRPNTYRRPKVRVA